MPTPVSGRSRLTEFVRRRPIVTGMAVVALLFLLDLALLPWGAVYDLRNEHPGTTAFQQAYLDRERSAGRTGSIRKRWLPIDRMPDHLIKAVIVAEDGLFWSHGGFDWFELRESILRNIKEQRAARGASTITQQLIKNLFLSPSKNPVRKYHEFLLTWYAEQVLSKRRILELYLNEIEWGRGIYGAEMAARTYYGISAADLTRDQAVRLAAVIPNPIRYKPTSDSRSVLRRAEIVRRRLDAREPVRGRAEDLPLEDAPAPIPGEALSPADSLAQPDSVASGDPLRSRAAGLPADTTSKTP